MNQTIRREVFETNSSSIHALGVCKEVSEENFDDLELEIKVFTKNEIEDTMRIKDLKNKIKYLWTIRCLYKKFDNKEFVKKFTKLLNKIFPKVTFVEENDPPYMEDFEYLKEDSKMLDESFMRKVLNIGEIIFTTRDGDYKDYKYDSFIKELRDLHDKSKNSNSEIDLIWSEG